MGETGINVVYAALITAIGVIIAAIIGSLLKHWLANKRKRDEADDKEKRALVKGLHDRLSELEERFLPTLKFSLTISQRLLYIANRVKRYDYTLSIMIRILRQDWKKVTSSPDKKSWIDPSDIAYLKSYVDSVGDRADLLLDKVTIGRVVKAWLSWVKLRIYLFKRNWRRV